jgi:hypothetical protein
MINLKLVFIAPLIFLGSCSFVSFSDAIPLFKAAVLSPPKIEISEEEFNSRTYSFIVAQFEDGPGAIMTLSNVADNGVLEWVSADSQLIYTRNGKVISTYGLQHDIQYLGWAGFNWEDPSNYPTKRLINLRNPDALAELNVSLQVMPGSDLVLQFETIAASKLLKETIKIELLKWQAENTYWLNDQGLTRKTIQTLHPKLPPLTIEFFYVFN